MKKTTKRFCAKSVAIILSTTILISLIVPMNVFVAASGTAKSLRRNTIDISNSINYSENIIREVEEERDENSKTFLMSDGTYYTYISPIPVHEFIDGEWVDIDDNLSETPSTISEAETTVKEYVEDAKATLSQISTFSTHQYDDEISITCIGNSNQTIAGYTLGANGALVIKPESIYKFSMENKVLISAILSTNIETNNTNNNRPLYIKHVTSEITSTTTYNDINSYSDIYYKKYDKTITEYTFDITDIYSKWERGNATNYGVALTGSGLRGAPLQINTPILSIRYKDVTANDASFTYHTLDLGRAGILSINDVTNAFKIEQTIAGIDCSLLPVSLIKTIYSTNFSLDSYANVSSEWNYNYSLSVGGTFASVTLPQGTILEFQKPQNPSTSDGYQVWEQITNEDYVGNAELYVKESSVAIDSLNNCYLDINGIEYWFNSMGKLKHIEKADKTLNVIYEYLFDFERFVITKLTDAVGNQYCISYSTYTVNNNNYVYANKIEVKDANNNAVQYGDTPFVVNISNTVENSIIKSSITYPSEIEQPVVINYYYDFNGKILSIQSEDGTITDLHYKSSDNTYLTGYTQTKNDEIINTFTITSNNTFERIFDGTLIQKEIQRYNSDFQLVSYHYGSNTIGMTYNEGSINSYAINNQGYIEDYNRVVNGDFHINPIDEGWDPFVTSYPEYDETNQQVVISNQNAGADIGLSQFISSITADTTYIFSCEVKAIQSIPSDDYALNVLVELFDKNGDPIKSYCLPFDVSLMNETQTRMCAFKTDIECDVIVSVYTHGNIGRFNVDNVRLYEATTEDGSVVMPTVITSDPISQSVNNHGLITYEGLSDSTYTMSQEYEYAEDTSKLISTSNFNGIHTYFDYATRTSKLTEKGYALKSDGSIENPISYSYNASGLLSTVKQIINNVETTKTTNLAQYKYDASERITSVTNNNYSYIFTYDNIGNITNIKKEARVENNLQSNNLIDYNYTSNNLGYIEYSNGYKLEYMYDEETGNITQINCLAKNAETNEYDCIGSYSYTYTNGNISEVLLDFDNLSYDVKIIKTATGTNIYHIFANSALLVYSKSHTSERATESFISSASGNNSIETFTKTVITETNVGNTTELYSAFSGTKTSAMGANSVLNYSGSNNIVKDYFGRVSSKYYTLESNVTDTSNNTISELSNLSLSHDYSYVTLDSSQNVTSNLIESINNTFIGESSSNGTTTENGDSISYNYIYDSKGNIRFVYFLTPGGDYQLENYYQYDESNQVTASYGNNKLTFFSYDNDGNIVKKSIGGNITVTGVENITINDMMQLSPTLWIELKQTNIDNVRISNSQPIKTIHFSYDTFARLTNYLEISHTYDSEGNVSNTTDIDLDIPYDNYGNPLKYIGDNMAEGTIIADLTWIGNQLQSAIIYDDATPHQKITFVYDENGYRINKTVFEYSSNTQTFTESMQTNYFWSNGNLTSIQLIYMDNGTPRYMYTNILYDNTGIPYGIITPTGLSYYFLRDASNSVRGLVRSTGEVIAYFTYDAFGNININVKNDTIEDAIVNLITALFNPCTYKGYLYDYELGMYFVQNKCYSPKYGRFLSEISIETLNEVKDNPLDVNLHLFCNNNPINNFDANAEWEREQFSFANDGSHGIQVAMSNSFLSRPVCILFASKIISDSGSWDYLNGRNIKNMGVERIASNLFARSVGHYAESAVNRVNATWGDGWIQNNRNSNTIVISETDLNYDKYLKIWMAAPSIKAYAAANGIYITL